MPSHRGTGIRTRRAVFFFNDTATTEIYTLSLHDALPIWRPRTRLSFTHRQLAPKTSVGETFSATSFTSTTQPPHHGNRVSDPYSLRELAGREGHALIEIGLLGRPQTPGEG